MPVEMYIKNAHSFWNSILDLFKTYLRTKTSSSCLATIFFHTIKSQQVNRETWNRMVPIYQPASVESTKCWEGLPPGNGAVH